jgi:hypothetical protein
MGARVDGKLLSEADQKDCSQQRICNRASVMSAGGVPALIGMPAIEVELTQWQGH